MYEELIERVRGDVIVEGEPGFLDSRTLWNGMIDTKPAVTVRASGAADVMHAVRYAAEHGVRVAAKCGGHNVAGRAVPDGGMLIDLEMLREVRVDADSQVARVGGGVRLGALDHEAQAFGLATTAGVDSRTGVGGLTLGGGIGWLARRFGLASDNLIGADVVTADGRLVHASARDNSDLFWALRGGGAGCGIVTTFEFQLHEVGPDVMVAQAYHTPDALGAVMEQHRQLMQDAPDEFCCYLLVIHAPPAEPFPPELQGTPVVALVSCDTGSTPDAQRRANQVLAIGDPFLAVAEPTPYTALQSAFDAGSPDGARYYFKSEMLPEVSDAVVRAVVDNIEDLPGPFTMLAIEPLGGAVGRVDADETAWPHRDAAANFGIFAGWEDPAADDAIRDWARRLHAAVAEHGTGGAYVNYLDTDDGDVADTAFGGHAARLAEIRQAWDPAGLFLAPGR